MNPTTILLLLKAVASFFGLQGKTRAAETILQLVSAGKSGVDIDAHMRLVADKLNLGEEPDWDEVMRRIAEDSARLHRD